MCSVDSPLDKTWPVLGWVGWDWIFLYCSHQNLESSDDGNVGTLSVLDADWSVITKYGGIFDLMNIDELSLSVTATVGCPLICCMQVQTNFSLLTSIPLLSQRLIWCHSPLLQLGSGFSSVRQCPFSFTLSGMLMHFGRFIQRPFLVVLHVGITLVVGSCAKCVEVY